MAYNYQQVPFWDFVRAFDQNGAGVDHQPEGPGFFGPPHHGAEHPPPPPPPPFGATFPFGGPWGGPWGRGGFGPGGFGGPGPHHHGGRGGRRGRHGHRDQPNENESPRSRTASPQPEGAEGAQTDNENRDGSGNEGGRRGRGPRRFGCRGRGGHGHGPRGSWGGWGNHHGRRGPPPHLARGMGGFDLSGLFEALNSHPVGQQPWAQMLRQYAEQASLAGNAQRSGETLVPEDADADADAENTFIPPIDVFSTETAYVLHIALPGAKKEDVGVNWDEDKGVLNVAGVVYRQGDEEFLKTLSQSERKVGVFERSVKLPPGDEEKEEVDSDAISAKLEDGVLMVTVPKVEKEWTEIKRVDVK